MADALTEYRAMLNKMLGSTDGLEVSALEQEVAHRLGLLFVSGTDTAGTPTWAVPVVLSDSLNVSGIGTFSDSLNVTGVFNPTGKVTHRAPEAVTAAKVLTAADSGKVFNIMSDTDGFVIDLPATAAGLWYAFNVESIGNTAADLIIAPAAVDQIVCDKATTAAPVDKDGIFVDASDTNVGDGGQNFIVLVGDGTTGWYAIAQRGTWKANTDPT
jgi:hypothetical protein